jgi:hypothetical protein
MLSPMTSEAMHQFAVKWIENWNRRDMEGVLSHFADDAQFISPKAVTFVGTPVLKSKSELRNYWSIGLTHIQRVVFNLYSTVCDPASRTLVVLYEADLNGTVARACEVMRFDEQGRQIFGEALYGAPV